MTMRMTTLLAVALLLSGACRPRVDVARQEEALLATDRAWAKAVDSGKDVDSVVAFWTDDARVVMAGMPVVQGKAAIREMVKGSMAVPGFHISWTPESAVVSASGDLGYTFGTNAVTAPDATGTLSTQAGQYITVWRKGADDRWQCVMDYSSPGPARATPAQTVSAPPPSADSLVSAALKSAQAGGRVVLVEFGASWCTWCRSFDAFVHAPGVSQIIANNYVIVNLTVQERDEKKALEHPGGQEKMNTWGGAKSGLPYYVFLDAAGRKLADSNAMPNGGNIGFPATPQEVQVFMSVIDKTAPKMSNADRAAVLNYLTKTLKP